MKTGSLCVAFFGGMTEMGFLSYNLRFYRGALQELENSPATQERLCQARRLLRILDDLTAEGYTELSGALEQTFDGVSRLRAYLHRNHAEPFAAPDGCPDGGLSYAAQDTELRCAIARAVCAAAGTEAACVPLAERLRRFCEWVGYDDGTAYIFLLRDTLLPFVYHSARSGERARPWLLSRSALAALTGAQNADDTLRAAVYRVLEAGCTDFTAFRRAVLPEMRRTVESCPAAVETLRAMLAQIDAERILVVESGCAGTFPLLLMSLDSRADLRMYTTYPYLTGIYAGRVYTARYEENRLLEAMAAHACYLRFSGWRDGRFYVRTCMDAAVEAQALAEIRAML